MKSIIITFYIVALCVQMNAQTTVICIDNSLSSGQDSTVLLKKANKAYNLLLEKVKEPGHTVLLTYLFENSGSVTNLRTFTYAPPIFEPLSTNPQQMELEKMDFEDAKEEYHDDFAREIVRAAFKYPANRPGTHILATLPLLNKANERHGNFELYILSDMLEVSPINNLQKATFRNMDEAFKSGKTDAGKIQASQNLAGTFLQGVKIQVYLPLQEMDSRSVMTWLEPYWQGVYTSFGLSRANLIFETL